MATYLIDSILQLSVSISDKSYLCVYTAHSSWSCSARFLFAAHRSWSTLTIARCVLHSYMLNRQYIIALHEHIINPTFVFLHYTLLRSCSARFLFAAHQSWSTLTIARCVLHSYMVNRQYIIALHEHIINPIFVFIHYTLLRSCSARVLFAAHRSWSTLL